MSVKQGTGYCALCQRQQRFEKPRINHLLHLILTVLTIGLWAVVWITLGVMNSSKAMRCVQCGWQQGRSAGPVAT